TTRAPWPRKARLIAAPRPRAPPVTSTTREESSATGVFKMRAPEIREGRDRHCPRPYPPPEGPRPRLAAPAEAGPPAGTMRDRLARGVCADARATHAAQGGTLLHEG